jgi:hypothetical protein
VTTAFLRTLESPAAFRAAVACYALALALGLKRFLVWDQILVLRDADFWGVFHALHPHALRWLALQPVMAFDRFGYDPHTVFTLLCLVLTTASACLLARAGAVFLPGREDALRVWTFLPLALVTIAMNGRLIPAFFGLSLLLALHVELAAGRPRAWGWFLAGQLLALLALSVSSGSFAVGAVACGGSWIALAASRWRDSLRRSTLLALLATALLLSGALVAAFARKALHFFGGDPLGVLGHGAGALLLPYGPVVALGGVVVICVSAVAATWLIRFPAGPGIHLRLPIAASVILGLCGWSTLVTALPALILVVAVVCARDSTTVTSA